MSPAPNRIGVDGLVYGDNKKGITPDPIRQLNQVDELRSRICSKWPNIPQQWADLFSEYLWDMVNAYIEENGQLHRELEKARERASETYRILKCPKCGTEFYDDHPEKDYGNGIICPACTGSIRGVIYPRVHKKFISQADWDAMKEERDRLRRVKVV